MFRGWVQSQSGRVAISTVIGYTPGIKNQSFSGRLLRLQDEERRRLARELHDTTGQNIAALQMNLALLSECAPSLPPRLRKVLNDSLNLAQTCVREIRSLSSALYPPMLDEAGVLEAVQAYVAEYSKRAGVRVNLDLPPRLARMPQETAITVLRVAQHCLLEKSRGSAGVTAIRLTRLPRSVVLEFAGPAAAQPIAPEIRERIHVLDGKVRLAANKLRVTLPVTTGLVESPR
jgi:signal transduction histidine kinase